MLFIYNIIGCIVLVKRQLEYLLISELLVRLLWVWFNTLMDFVHYKSVMVNREVPRLLDCPISHKKRIKHFNYYTEMNKK